ncbi:hypothetical protein [Fibrobacter sp. UWB11]|uniref:hypothetical protein n=1 Tax=Fibrobacter sp. UWB11 TaxID=1896202 RepID=UPI00092974B6|nr:hypothetical protein [Fibrobacter sp. UWB11]SIN86425.1 hypothetical protein SAMN05720758_0303 [Fibrobacter sp. UWB11]
MICNNNTQQSEFFLNEPANALRGKSAIIWTFVSLVFTILAWISIEVLIQIFTSYTKGSMTTTESIALCISLFFIAVYSIILLVYIYKFSIWIYYAVKEQNQFTSTELTPTKAVLLGCVIGPFIDAFIFKDLFHKQNAILENHGLKPAALPEWTFTATLVLSFLIMSTFITVIYLPGRIVLIILASMICALYIKIMKAIIENGRLLQIKRFDDLVNRKVEEILKQRENS